MDIFPTLLSLAGVTPPSDRRYDGMDVTSVLLGGEQTGHKVAGLTVSKSPQCRRDLFRSQEISI